MTVDDGEKSRQADGPASTDDSGLRCLNCRHNLTGLSSDQCPECGRALNWDEIRAAAALTPHIQFEKASIAFKPIGFVHTWLTVLLAPWIFARQSARLIHAGHALAFGGVCFAGTWLSLLFDNDVKTMMAWLSTAAVYLVFQTILLTLIEPHGWRRPIRTGRYWALIGGYTSAIMLTEMVRGPPLILLSDVVEFLLGRSAVISAPFSGTIQFYWWLQIVVWLIGLACCYFARLRRSGSDVFSAVSASLLAAGALFLLYCATVEYIGAQFYHLFNDTF